MATQNSDTQHEDLAILLATKVWPEISRDGLNILVINKAGQIIKRDVKQIDGTVNVILERYEFTVKLGYDPDKNLLVIGPVHGVNEQEIE